MKIKNIVLVGGGSSGKTTIAEVLLYKARVIERVGNIEAGTTTLDYDVEEIKRKYSINTAIASINQDNIKINILDTPGYSDFIGDFLEGVSVADGGVLVIDAEVGYDSQAERIVEHLKKSHIPYCIFINKIDKEKIDLHGINKIINTLKEEIEASVVCITQPIFKENKKEIHNLLDNPEEGQMYTALQEAAAEADDALCEQYLEKGSLNKEEIKKGLLEGIRNKKIICVLCGSAALDIGINELLDFINNFMPLADSKEIKVMDMQGKEETFLCNESQQFIAYVFKVVQDPYVGELSYIRVYSGQLFAGDELYNPRLNRSEKISQICYLQGKQRMETKSVGCGDIAALVKFRSSTCGDTLLQSNPTKTVRLKSIEFPEPLMSIAINPKTKQDQEKISNALARMTEEDPTFKTTYSHELSQTIISGMGELHLEVILARLKQRYGIQINIEKLKIPYREAITRGAKGEGKYKRQTGGRGQYGHALLEIEPLPLNTETTFEFVDKIVGGIIPAKYIPAVEKGVKEALQKGILAGYPILWIKVTLYDGSFHEVDSSDIAFNLAGSFALKDAFQKASPIILEPIMDVEVTVPRDNVGNVIGDLNSRRGRILGMEPCENKKYQLVKAYVPQAEMDKYFIDLRSITQGRGSYKMTFSHYEQVPQNIADKITQESKK